MAKDDLSDPEELNDLLRGKQPVRTAVLERILGSYGFIVEKGNQGKANGSHLKYEHDRFKITVGLVVNSTDVRYQQKVAEACFQVRALIREEREQQLALHQENHGFVPAVTVDARTAVPDQFEALSIPDFPDSVIIRWKNLPQIGTIDKAQITTPALKETIRKLLSQTVEFENVLAETQKRFDFKIELDPERHLSITQRDYGLSIRLIPFGVDHFSDAIQTVRAFAGYCGDIDRWLARPIEQAIKDAAAHGAATGEANDDGSINWVLNRRGLISGEEQTVRFKTSSAYRMDRLAAARLFDEIFRFDFTHPDDPKFLSKLLKERWGFEMTRPRVGKMLGPALVGTHPFYPEVGFSVPVPDALPSIVALTEKAARATGADDRARLEREILDTRLAQNEVNRVLDLAMDVFLLEQGDNETRHNVALTSLIEMGFTALPSTARPAPGEVYHVRLIHPEIPTVLDLRSMDVRKPLDLPGENKTIIITHPEDVRQMEKLVEELQPDSGELRRKMVERFLGIHPIGNPKFRL